ncbi:MAG TPA: hypothetical protein VFP35_01200 [Candidatus Saccharimonadales bacterium]|nr:hypothetical protein [Candidatus Saccharimonadales bacterium]
MPETASEATQTAEQPIPMRYDGDKGMYLPDNGGNVINFQPVMTQTNGGEAAPGTVRQIPVAEVPAGPAPGETPTTAPEQNGETAELKQQIEELRAQLAQEQEERKRQQDEQTKAIKGLASALKAQNKLLKQLLEQKKEPTEPTEPTEPKPKDPTEPEPDPDEEEKKKKEEEERKRAEEEEEARKKTEEENNDKIIEKALGEARQKLLEIVIRRRGRMGDKFTFRPDRGQADKELYDQAMKEYLDMVMFNAGYLRQKLEEQMQKETGEIDPEAIRQAITKFVYEEQTKLADQEVALNNQLLNDSIENSNVVTRPIRKFLRKYADASLKKKILMAAVPVIAVGIASGTAGVGLAVLAAGATARLSMGLMNRKASLMNDSKNHLRKYKGGLDKEFQETMANLLGDDPNQLESRLLALIDSTEGNVDEQIKKAQRRNKIGSAVMVASGVLFGLSAGGVELIPSVMDGVHHLEHAVEGGVHHGEHMFGGGHHGGPGVEHGHGGLGHPGVENGGGTPPGLSHGESLTHYGDTIWYHARADLANQLGRTPNNHEVWDATQQILNKNGLSWEQARHLPVNYQFSVPETLRT